MALQHAHVELDHVPADDRVRVVLHEPRFHAIEQLAPRGAVGEIVIARAIDTIGWSQHVHLALPAAFERDRAQFALECGLDIERHGADGRPVARRGLHHAFDQQVRIALDGLTRKHDGRGNETLHQVALGRTHVGLEHVQAMLAQAPFDLHQLAVFAAVQAGDGPVLKVEQVERAQFPAPFILQ